MEGLEPASDGTRTQNSPSRHRCGDALDLDGAEITVLEHRLPTCRRVVWAMRIASGSAKSCSRAARFGVSPTTDCSCAEPSPIRSPTTTSPVAMPTRACNLTDLTSSRATASVTPSPARTARSASSSRALMSSSPPRRGRHRALYRNEIAGRGEESAWLVAVVARRCACCRRRPADRRNPDGCIDVGQRRTTLRRPT